MSHAVIEERRLIHIIRRPATIDETKEMLHMLGAYIKLAVDVNRGVLAGGGAMHADCESELLNDGSAQEHVWGADWYPASHEVTYESLINIRPAQGNRSLEIQNPILREQIKHIVIGLLGGVSRE